MSNPERDTQFQVFAKLLAEELYMAKCQEAAKLPVHVLDHATLPIGINMQIVFVKVEYDGKQYTGALYPMEDEESNEQQ